MYVLNILDESNRFVKVKYFNNNRTGQDNSHTYSYLYSRQEYKKMGDIMGLEEKLKVGEDE